MHVVTFNVTKLLNICGDRLSVHFSKYCLIIISSVERNRKLGRVLKKITVYC